MLFRSKKREKGEEEKIDGMKEEKEKGEEGKKDGMREEKKKKKNE